MGFHEEYADHIRSHGEHLGEQFTAGGPQAVLHELEAMVPESWREHVVDYPLTAIALGVAAGIFLGIRLGEEILAAGSTMVGAATAAHARSLVASVTDRVNQG